MFNRRGMLPSLGFLVAIIGILGLSQPASADPHAMFFTTVGQQQLFFNVLAALDQADYVETQRARLDLVERRRGADQTPPEPDPTLQRTKTDLSAVITRNITLEGQDLWSTYLSLQLALEAAGRNNTDEIARIYCQRGLGREKCENDVNNPQQQKRDKANAFIVDAKRHNNKEATLGVAGQLSSSYTGADQAFRKNLDETKKDNELSEEPYPFSNLVAELKENTANDRAKELAVERLIAGTKRVYRADDVNPNAFKSLAIDDESGQVQLKPIANETGERYMARYIDSIDKLMELPIAFLDTAEAGAREVEVTLAAGEAQGALADTSVQQVQDPKTKVYKDRNVEITVPAHAKVALTEQGANAIVQKEADPAFVPPRAESEVGRQPFVERGGRAAGISTTAGNVAGTIDPPDPSNPDDPTHHANRAEQLNLNSNPIGFHHEQGPAHLLQALGFEGKKAGCGCHNTQLANDYGRLILRKINGL